MRNAPQHIDWRRNLVFAWLSQLLSLMGFAFALPFLAFFLQKDLGVTEPARAKMWMGIFTTVVYVSLAGVAPLWGLLADKFGRKAMMLRANLGATLVVTLMGMCTSVYMLLVLRILQGLLSGTVSAAQTLVASYTPTNRQGLALGAMNAAVFAGNCLGFWAGGEFAYHFGYRKAFLAGGGILFLSVLLVVFGIRERFEPRDERAVPLSRSRLRLPSLGFGGPILLAISAMAFVQAFDNTMLPFLVQEIHGRIHGAERIVARVSMLASVGAFLGGFLWGWVADRFAPAKMAKLCAVVCAFSMLPQMLAFTFPPLMFGRLGLAFCAGGLDPAFQIWLARMTPEERRGRVFGWAVTAKCCGWMLAPIFSAYIGAEWGVRYSFFATALLFVLLIPVISFVTGKVTHPISGLLTERTERSS